MNEDKTLRKITLYVRAYTQDEAEAALLAATAAVQDALPTENGLRRYVGGELHPALDGPATGAQC